MSSAEAEARSAPKRRTLLMPAVVGGSFLAVAAAMLYKPQQSAENVNLRYRVGSTRVMTQFMVAAGIFSYLGYNFFVKGERNHNAPQR